MVQEIAAAELAPLVAPAVAVDLLRPDGGGMMTLEMQRALVGRILEMVEIMSDLVERTLEMVDMVEMDRAPTMIAIEGLPRLSS